MKNHHWNLLIATFLTLVIIGSGIAGSDRPAYASAARVDISHDCSAYLMPTQGIGEVLPVVNNANPSEIRYFQDYGGVFGIPEQISVSSSSDGGQTHTLLGPLQPPTVYSSGIGTDIGLSIVNGTPFASVCDDWTVLLWQRN